MVYKFIIYLIEKTNFLGFFDLSSIEFACRNKRYSIFTNQTSEKIKTELIFSNKKNETVYMYPEIRKFIKEPNDE